MSTISVRLSVWAQTQAVARSIASSVPPSVKLCPADVDVSIESLRMGWSTDISLEDADCIDVALRLKEGEARMRPLVLTLADDREAGWGVAFGTGAQEESLWRRTALCVTQKQDFYPLGREAIYSPGVPVLRRSEQEGYRWYDVPKVLDFVACPAIKMPEWVEPDGDLRDVDKEELAERVRLILRVAATKGHDAVVLGAMGCGGWNNPPRAVARVFARILPEFQGVFKQIVVAILNTGGQGKIMQAFEDVFAVEFAGAPTTP
jgi:uncharacterized protein (TIGR02452 family)